VLPVLRLHHLLSVLPVLRLHRLLPVLPVLRLHHLLSVQVLLCRHRVGLRRGKQGVSVSLTVRQRLR